MKNVFISPAILLFMLNGCQTKSQRDIAVITVNSSYAITEIAPETIAGIRIPGGFKRPPADGFASYLRNIKLRKDNTVYLFNGKKKSNQEAQFAVIDMSVGQKDLQQCADAVMRIRAEYLYSTKQYDQIKFFAGDGTCLAFTEWLAGKRFVLKGKRLVAIQKNSVANTHDNLLQYLELVFSYCGTATLPTHLYSKPMEKMQAGDVLLKPGSPGHAVIVMDIATNASGKKIYLLAQSYMPAQDIHVLHNPAQNADNPWYTLDEQETISTPEWTFYKDQLYGWK